MIASAAPWAKLAYEDDGRTVRAALPLVDHAFDVAACGEALLAGGAWRRALEATAGRPLTDLDLTRIVALMALHDIGKANWGFQARWDPRADKIGHEGQVAPLWFDPTLRESSAGKALRDDTVLPWGAHTHLFALMAHHGRPREEFSGPPPTGGRNTFWEEHRSLWHPRDGYDPLAAAADLMAQVRARYPLAWQEGPKLPDTPRFVALFAGLVTLADWLGSDTKRFPIEGPYRAGREPIRREAARRAVAAEGLGAIATPPADFAAVFGESFAPRGVQGQATAADLGPVALIEAETGSGKTEAALWRWLDLRRRGEVDGLYFALPTRSAAIQLHRRVDHMLVRIWGKDGPRAFLAVPGYRRVGDAEGEPLPGWATRWDDGRDDGRWAAERSNRYLAARVAVGTIDQALLAALRVKHSPVRAAALARSLLVVDEVHASDAYMGALLKRLLDNHVHAGGHALLLSATLGAEARTRLLGGDLPPLAEAAAQPYPALAGTGAALRAAPSDGSMAKPVAIELAPLIDDPGAVADRAVAAARAGASVLVVRNSVSGAVAVAQAVEALAPDLAFRVNDVATLHHGRFAPRDRRLLDQVVEAAFGKGRAAQGRVLVGTQTLEQSLDFDADLLITDLAPMDVLLQRIGRLHRHPRSDRGTFADARAVVLTLAERDLTRLLGRIGDRHGLGPIRDAEGVYPDLLQIEATLRLLHDNPQVVIPADNRRLVEGALHPEVRDGLTAELGTAWTNHDAALLGTAFAERRTAIDQSVDFARAFHKLVFPPDEGIGTRLGAQDWLIDVEQPFTGPFGACVDRLSIPHWMAGDITREEQPLMLDADESGQRFRLGGREYLYGRWGLSEIRSG